MNSKAAWQVGWPTCWGAAAWVCCLAMWGPGNVAGADSWKLREGVVAFEPGPEEAAVPPRFRLKAARFAYQERRLPEISDEIQISDLTFPSPVVTDSPANNTVHCEWYRPKRPARQGMPAVVVLHILGGDFALSRVFCNSLAHRGVAALFLKMPYYGPRRAPGSSRRMISPDPHQTVAGMTQAILDIRRGVTWLADQPEVDGERLGVFGISLGGITGALATTADPRIGQACLLLAGGDVGEILWESREAAPARRQWVANGGTREQLLDLLKQVDPVTYRQGARGKRILMLNASNDEVVPKACTESLWEAFGRPRIVWYSGGHYSVGRHLFSALDEVGGFFAVAPSQP